MKNFLQELQRRNVIKSSVTFLVISWLILQVAAIIFPIVGVDPGAMKLVLLMVVICFPIWVTFAYIYEWTPSGFKKTDDVAPEVSVYKSTSKRLNAFIIGGLTLTVLILVADRFLNFTGQTIEVNRERSIAVLPFENMSGDDDAYFVAGVTDDILTHISKIKDLRVLSRFTLRDYVAKGKSIAEIGTELGVGYLLTGSMRRQGDDLRIACQLVQVTPEEETWAENFDKRMEDIFAIQKEVATEVANYLKANLSPEEQQRIAQIPTKNIEAYNIYLRGREEYNKYEPETMKKAIEYYKEALALDPKFGLAWAGLADAYALGVNQFRFLTPDYLDSAIAIGEKAVNLAPQSAEAWKAWGFAYDVKGLFDEATAKYENAIELNPAYEPAIGNLGIIMAQKGRLVEAIALEKKRLRINPLSINAYGALGDYYQRLEMYPESAAYLEKSLQLSPRQIAGHYYAAFLYSTSSEPEKATHHLQELISIDSENAFLNEIAAGIAFNFDKELARSFLTTAVNADGFDPQSNWGVSLGMGYLLWEDGNQDSARIWLEPSLQHHLKQAEEGNEDLDNMYAIVQHYAVRSDKVEALKWLRKVVELGHIDRMTFMNDMRLSSIEQEDEFQKLMAEIDNKLSKMRLTLSSEIEDNPQIR